MTERRPAIAALVAVFVGLAVLALLMLVRTGDQDTSRGHPAEGPTGTLTAVSPGSFWYTPLPGDVRLDEPATPQAAADLAAEAHEPSGAYINTTSYSSPITVVSAATPRVPVTLTHPDWHGVVPRYDKTLAAVLAEGVPIPEGYQEAPASDTDAEGVFYCPRCMTRDGKRGILWELWRLRKDAAGRWTAYFGGRMAGTSTNPGYWVDRFNGARYPDLPTDPRAASSFESRLWGATATSLPLAAGEITVRDVRRGRIDHALGFAALPASVAKGFRWPAQRGDGYVADAPLEEGMRLRLPVDTDCRVVSQPVGRMICDAVRRFGMVLWDRAGALSFRAEPAVSDAFHGVPPSRILDGFPWEKLVVLATGSAEDPNLR